MTQLSVDSDNESFNFNVIVFPFFLSLVSGYFVRWGICCQISNARSRIAELLEIANGEKV